MVIQNPLRNKCNPRGELWDYFEWSRPCMQGLNNIKQYPLPQDIIGQSDPGN